jgi:hypothetical protein
MAAATPGCNDRAVIRHCVLLRFDNRATADQRQALLDGLATMPDAIDAIERYDFGPDATGADGNWDLAVTADFADTAAYREYAGHETHVQLITERIKPILAERAAVQFEITG